MKTSDIFPGISVLLFSIVSFLPHEPTLSQDENSIPVKQQDKGTFNLIQHCLTLPQFDTVRPALINCGKGLSYYECIFLKHEDKTYLFNSQGEDPPIMKKASFTELELEILKQNMLFIDEQYKIQIKEWIRKEKMDLNLGEAIKGFYMDPIF